MSSKNVNPKQGSLLQEISNIEIKNRRKSIEKSIKNLLSHMYSHSAESRYQIAANISEIIDSEVSYDMLNNYTGESKRDCKVPAAIAVLSTIVCRDYSLFHYLCESVGGGFVEPDDLNYLNLVKVQKQISELKETEIKLKRKIGG